jgi:hypothetical protein
MDRRKSSRIWVQLWSSRVPSKVPTGIHYIKICTVHWVLQNCSEVVMCHSADPRRVTAVCSGKLWTDSAITSTTSSHCRRRHKPYSFKMLVYFHHPLFFQLILMPPRNKRKRLSSTASRRAASSSRIIAFSDDDGISMVESTNASSPAASRASSPSTARSVPVLCKKKKFEQRFSTDDKSDETVLGTYSSTTSFQTDE